MNLENTYWGKTIFLDNENNYQVIWITNYKEKKYTYLLNINDYTNLIFCEFIKDDTLRKLTDKNEIIEIMVVMNKEMNIFIR